MHWLLKYRFSVLSCSVFGLVLAITWKGVFYGDFWEHSAVIRELSTNIFAPNHPQLLLTASHVFYSPYSVMVAFLARLFQLNSIHALMLMVIINYWLFVFALRFLIQTMFPKNYQAIAFYSFLLILFWWGWDPWGRSGFYHIGVMVLVMSYPSSFCTALSFIAIALYKKRLQKESYLAAASIIAMASFVMLSHPPTFLFLAIILIAFSTKTERIFNKNLIGCAIILGLASALAVLWPYFSIIELATNQSTIYHQFNTLVYIDVLSKSWPILIAFLFIIFKKRYNWRHQLVIAIALLTAIYLYGWISEKYGYGRVISFILLLLQIIIAENFADWEVTGIKFKNRLIMQAKHVCAGMVIICILLSAVPLARTGYWILLKHLPHFDYVFLANKVGQYDVVLSDMGSNWYIPSFGGKVVAVKHPIAFVDDHEQRRKDVQIFFDIGTEASNRLAIMEKYRINYLLLQKNITSWNDIARSVAPHGKIVYESGKNVLILINKPLT